MKQVISDLLAKATEFLQQLAAKKTGSHSINIEELKRSVSSATLNLRSRISESESGSVQTDSETSPVTASKIEVETPVVEVVAASVSEAVAENVAVEAIKPANPPKQKAAVVIAVADSLPQVPEDSALRRHYLTQRQAELLAELGDEPSDSTLKRHYQQLLAVKTAK